MNDKLIILSLFFNLSINCWANSQPNILFIAIDDLNNWVGALNPEMNLKTPHIDKLASEGTLFTNAHCAVPACNPSRTSVMTGLQATTSGVYYNQQDWRLSQKLKGAITIPQHFKNHGYKVMGGGKLYHAATLSRKGYTGLLDPKPWDEFYPSKERQMPEEVSPPNFPVNGDKKFYKGFFDWGKLDINDDEMADAKVVAWAEKQLLQKHEKPLFMAVGIYRPHIPWYTPKSYFNEYNIESLVMPEIKKNDLNDVPKLGQDMARRSWQEWMLNEGKYKEAVQAYKASATFADAMVGRVIKALNEGPLSENTIVVLWSDHGYHLGHKEHWEKFALWGQTTQVPLIVKAPNFKAGLRVNNPTSLIDIYPTLVELSKTKSRVEFDGKSLVPWLKEGSQESTHSVLITQGRGNHAVRSKDWHYIRYEDGSDELYHTKKDPNQFDNLSKKIEFLHIVKEHSRKIPEHEAQLDPFYKRVPKKY